MQTNNNLEKKQNILVQRLLTTHGNGYNFVYLSVPSGSTLLQASLWNDSTTGITVINKLTDTQYILIFNEAIPSSVKLDIEYCYVEQQN